MNISRNEYKLLKKMYYRKELIMKNNISATLEKKHLIEIVEAFLNEDGSEKAFRYVMTNDGVIAFEQYREERLNKRNISIRSWIAIVISLIALIVTILK